MAAPVRAARPHEEALHGRLCAGEEAALGELYDGFAPLVLATAVGALADQDAAALSVREVFAQLWSAPQEFDPAAGGLGGSLTARLATLTGPVAGAGARPGAARPDDDGALDLPPELRAAVLADCRDRRAPAVPVPPHAAAYAEQTARLDALVRDLGDADWAEPVRLVWHQGDETTHPAQVLTHLAAVDGVLARVLGLPDPAGGDGDGTDGADPSARTDALLDRWRDEPPHTVRARWREQSRRLVADASRAAADTAGAPPAADYGAFQLPLPDAFVERAFECWVHADDIAEAVGYPYPRPSAAHLHDMAGLAARLLPAALAALPGAPAAPGSSVRLTIEGDATGTWTVPLAPGPATEPVAEVSVDAAEFCYLCAGHRDPLRTRYGVRGDAAAARTLLTAAPLLSRR